MDDLDVLALGYVGVVIGAILMIIGLAIHFSQFTLTLVNGWYW